MCLIRDHGEGTKSSLDRVEDQPWHFEGDRAQKRAVPRLAENDRRRCSISVNGKKRVSDSLGHLGAIGEREDPWTGGNQFVRLFQAIVSYHDTFAILKAMGASYHYAGRG